MTDVKSTLPAEDILYQALNWKKDGREVALATVINTWGSAPRPAGSQLAIDETGQMVGSVSGGCVEGAVIQEALEILKSGQPKTLEFGVSNDEAWEVGLACGGKINVFVEKLD
ncbi:XdhC family protein [Sneathiella litorea]|uniref:XdhC family protein n=1 Tax=Sneathiella litorea TaxID=2606216 RepID=A0A6L8W7U4_9PROT|nr:XdhC family protein [Sneathiella litorea]MZR30582.1 XdhC family protein [Sneathiella litorea]